MIKIRQDKPVMTLETLCTYQNDQVLLRGEARVVMEKS